MTRRTIEIMDTTLRDGEQTPNVAYSPPEKYQLARILLDEVKVDRLEIASARVSEGEAEAVRRITAWARKTRIADRIEILGFVDGRNSVDWIQKHGGRVLNLLTKGSRHHCEKQLRMAPERHFKAIAETIRYAHQRDILVNVYLEDWSSGVRASFDYVFAHIQNLAGLGVKRIYLPDTLGVLAPADTHRYVELMTRTWPELHFEFHGHNDYGLATANCLAAVEAGVRGIHTSVNGMGERAGNSRLAEVVAAIHDLTDARTSVCESRLIAASDMVATFSGKPIAHNAPVIGRDVFTQTAGIHADGDSKADLYANRLLPRRFGRQRRYALGKLAGKASVDQNLKELGVELSPENRELVLRRIVELGDKKHTVTIADLPLILADVLKTPAEELVRIEQWEFRSTSVGTPSASVTLNLRGRTASAEAAGDGGYDAFMNALAKALRGFRIALPRLVDYQVRIPPGGKTGALVETLITWQGDAKTEPFVTLGVDPDQLAAAVIATEKMLNLVAQRRPKRS